MISESFLNICVELIFAKKSIELDASVCQDIDSCLDFFEKKVGDEIPVILKNKFDLLKKICATMAQGGTLSEIQASILASGKYHPYLDYLQIKSEMVLDEKTQSGHLKAVRQMVVWMKISGDYKRWKDYFERVGEGNIETLEETITEYVDLVKSSFNDVVDFEIKSSLGLVSSLNAPHDDCTRIINEVRKKYSPKNVIPSGIRQLDEEYLFGGFQPSRAYLFGGTSGVGKSILLLNLAIRGAMSGVPIDSFWGSMPTLDSEPERLFLYVTLENYIYETWLRLYSCLTRKTKAELLPEIRNGSITPKEIQEAIGRILAPCNCSIQVEYFPSNTISPVNIAALIKKYDRNPGIRAAKAVYLDYLDLLQPDEKNEFYRLDLGAITSRLKTIAASFEIPIITATQLNREAYRREKDKGLGMETISESIQKVFIADFGAIIQRVENVMDQTNGDQPPQPVKAILKVEKNRDGRVGKMDLYFDYPRSRILTAEEYREEFGGVLRI